MIRLEIGKGATRIQTASGSASGDGLRIGIQAVFLYPSPSPPLDARPPRFGQRSICFV